MRRAEELRTRRRNLNDRFDHRWTSEKTGKGVLWGTVARLFFAVFSLQ
jgi:hypothetical protein